MAENVQKAKIVKVSDPSKQVVCHFNPTNFKLGKKLEWKTKTNIGGDVSELKFSGGKAHELGPIEFLFDTTDTGEDVRDTYRVLLDLASVDQNKKNTQTNKGQPPLCRFEWGMFLSFTAVITELNQTFTMFKANGTPVRAKVAVKLLQVPEQIKPQNPTSRSESRKIWVVREGQTLDWIAYQEYGDPVYWRHIAETNNLLNPKALRPGQVLKLIPLA
jgi:hypothetical protein